LSADEVEGGSSGLARRLTLFDAAMLVMGGIIGSGIFVTPSEVARHVGMPFLIVGVWVLGGVVFALAGVFVYAELAVRRPALGGQYAYLRDAYGPFPAFLYGWSLLLVIQSGGMAAVAITFARYVNDFAHLGVNDTALAIAAVALLTLVNCLGVRSGSNVQSLLMMLKILAIVALIGAGLWLVPAGVGHPLKPQAAWAASAPRSCLSSSPMADGRRRASLPPNSGTPNETSRAGCCSASAE
jgi:APA family basic amino acid/polyamine antiporter